MDRLFNDMQQNDVLETTNIKSIGNFYKILLEVNNNVSSSRIIGVYETLYILRAACSKYLSLGKNKDSKFKNLVAKNEFVNELYTFYEEITLVYAAVGEDAINEMLDSDISKLYLEIIECYKSILNTNNVIDENTLYTQLIKQLSDGSARFTNVLQYNDILLKGFDVINMRYSILINAISKGYSIAVKRQLPYSKDIFVHFENAYDTNYINSQIFNNITIDSQTTDTTNAALMKSIFVDYDSSKALAYDNIHFMAGFGNANEVKNVCSHVLKLLNDKTPAYAICIMYDNNELYHTKVIDMCKKMGISFVERRGEPLWNIPLIVALASILEIFKKSASGKIEVDVDRLSNILSSPYVQIEHLDYKSIRSIIYSKSALHLYSVMEYGKLKSKLEYKIKSYNELQEKNGFDELLEEYKNATFAIIQFLEQVYTLITAKKLCDIGQAYLEILKYIKIDEAIKVHGINTDHGEISGEIADEISLDKLNKQQIYLVERDNNALAKFIKNIHDISFNTDIDSGIIEKNVLFHFTTILNEMMRKEYIDIYNKDSRAVTISTLYDVRYHDYEHIFILGMDSSFLSRSVSNFFVSDKKRESLNTKYNYPLFTTTSSLNCDAMMLIANIISSSTVKNGAIYLSLPYKDENGTLNLPHNFVEEIFYKKTLSEFTFENLLQHALIYQENYIQNVKDSTNDDETIMGFFRHGQTDSKIYIRDNNLDVKSIISSIQRRSVQSSLAVNSANASYFMKHFLNQGLSATDILNILICPQYFLDIKLFSGDELEKDELGIQYSDIGSIYHNIFDGLYKIIFKKFGTNMYNSSHVAEWYKTLDYVVDDVFGRATILADENEIDMEFMKKDVHKNCSSFIEKEFARVEDENQLYIPSHFEYRFDKYSIYKNNDIDIKINGRIDRIDLHYIDKEYQKVDGVRIVDYKRNVKTIRDSIDIDNIQLILYLSYVVNSREKFGLSEFEDMIDMKKSIAYIGYEQLNDKSIKYFKEHKKADVLNALVLGLSDTLEPIFEKISSGIVDYRSTEDGCSICRKKDICPKSYYLSSADD